MLHYKRRCQGYRLPKSISACGQQRDRKEEGVGSVKHHPYLATNPRHLST